MQQNYFLLSERLISVISLFPVWLVVMCTEQLHVRPRTQTHKCTRMCLKSPPAQQLTVSLVLPDSLLSLYLLAFLSKMHSVTAGGLTRHRLRWPHGAGVCQRVLASVRPSVLNPRLVPWLKARVHRIYILSDTLIDTKPFPSHCATASSATLPHFSLPPCHRKRESSLKEETKDVSSCATWTETRHSNCWKKHFRWFNFLLQNSTQKIGLRFCNSQNQSSWILMTNFVTDGQSGEDISDALCSTGQWSLRCFGRTCCQGHCCLRFWRWRSP